MEEASELEGMSEAPTIEGSLGGPAPKAPNAGGDLQREALKQRLFGESKETKIGRYRLLEKLGQGGMGVVYSAVDDDLDRQVALKVLHAEDERLAKRLQREARSMAKLSHPNVVTVHEVTKVDDRLCVAMEYVPGKTMGDWMKSSPSLEEIRDVFAQAGRGLQAAHEAGIIHRDFKPDNVLVGDDGRVRVLDFGLAKTDIGTANPEDLASIDLERLTATGVIMGTPRYMAPEQFEATATDARTDQFSFCIALYEAVFGNRPFDGRDLPSIGLRVVQGEVNPPPADSQVPKPLESAIMQGLKVDADDRHDSMLDIIRVLEGQELAVAEPASTSGGDSSKVIVGIIAAVAVLAAIAFFALG